FIVFYFTFILFCFISFILFILLLIILLCRVVFISNYIVFQLLIIYNYISFLSLFLSYDMNTRQNFRAMPSSQIAFDQTDRTLDKKSKIIAQNKNKIILIQVNIKY